MNYRKIAFQIAFGGWIGLYFGRCVTAAIDGALSGIRRGIQKKLASREKGEVVCEEEVDQDADA